MFGFGGLSEVVFILFLAMLIFGPEKLPEIGRMLAKGMAEVRKASNELKRTLNAELAISEQEKEARRLQETAPFPPPTAPAWSGGQTVPNLDAPGASAVAPASVAAAPVAPAVLGAPAVPADIGEAAEADESSEAAYLAAWPEDGSSPAATGPPAQATPSTWPAPAATADLPAAAAPTDAAVSAAPAAAAPGAPAEAAAPAAPAAAAPGAPTDTAAPDAPAVLAPALLETHGAGSGRDSA